MLRTLFEAIESSGGESLRAAASLVYALGALLVAWRALSPVAGGVLEAAAAGAGLHLGFTLNCRSCGARSLARAKCEQCGAALGVSAPVRLWAHLRSPGAVRKRHVAFVMGVLGSTVFVAATAAAALALHALDPRGTVERLLIGAAAVAWAGAGFLLGRAFAFGGIGPLSRLRELAFGSGALAVALLAALLAQAARPEQLAHVARLQAQDGAVLVDGKRLAIEGSELSLQYQLLESPALGLAVSTPLALQGAQGASVPLPHGGLEGFILDAAWSRAEALNGRGIAVRRKAETFRVTAGETYELKLSEREPALQKVKAR